MRRAQFNIEMFGGGERGISSGGKKKKKKKMTTRLVYYGRKLCNHGEKRPPSRIQFEYGGVKA